MLTILAGAVMITAGLLRLVRFTRFVSHSVIIGFLSEVAVNIIFGQIRDLTGVPAERDRSRRHPPDPRCQCRVLVVAALRRAGGGRKPKKKMICELCAGRRCRDRAWRVAESRPNEDGTRSNSNTDFIAQGLGNVGAGLFRGQPVGGSVGQTALNRAAGARTRWASIFSGLWMLLPST